MVYRYMDSRDRYIGVMLDNRYEILEKVGEGGMAIVYKARCHRLNRLVAIKILRDEYSQDDDFQRRFHAESQAVAMLSHPNIMAVYDVNRFEGIEYLVMELLDGITLKQYMSRKSSLNWREALHFVTQIVRALGHAHSRGIIHRDIKPHNIMVLRDGSVKVADFGIARLTSSQSTLTQEALGSVHYISPEQAKGGMIDARSDIYSVGIVLYEMLTGRLPFEGDSPVSIAIQHISSMPLTPREIDPSIPEGIEEITMKAMAADVEQRYASADDMYADLEEFRKNPSIVFGYTFVGADAVSDLDEPTIIIPKARAVVQAPPNDIAGRTQPQSPQPVRRQNEPRRKERDRPMRASRIPMVIAVIAVLAIVVMLFYFLWGVISPIIFPETNDLEVPSLLGLKYEDVILDPKYGDFEIVKNQEIVYNGGTPGEILSQRPVAGRTAAEGSTITVTVSGGTRKIVLDDYKNVEQRLAETRIISKGLSVGQPEFENSDEILKNYVIRTIPEAGAEMEDGEEVILVLSLGPDVVKVIMPDLATRTEEAAKQALSNANLTYGGTVMVESQQPAGEVAYQSPQAGLEVDEGTSVTLYVSLGPPEDPDTSPSHEPGTSQQPDTSQQPATPTPTPETPQEVSKTIDITLPNSGGKSSVQVMVKVNNSTVFNQTVETSQKIISVTITGTTKSVWVDIYFDGKLEYAFPEELY